MIGSGPANDMLQHRLSCPFRITASQDREEPLMVLQFAATRVRYPIRPATSFGQEVEYGVRKTLGDMVLCTPHDLEMKRGPKLMNGGRRRRERRDGETRYPQCQRSLRRYLGSRRDGRIPARSSRGPRAVLRRCAVADQERYHIRTPLVPGHFGGNDGGKMDLGHSGFPSTLPVHRRTKRRSPVSSSSCWIVRLRVDWLTPSCTAALRKLPCSATA
jgi:hypothetical protein